jgi:hypothetical protein
VIRQLGWSIFLLLTFGTVSFEIIYDDGLYLKYESWLQK